MKNVCIRFLEILFFFVCVLVVTFIGSLEFNAWSNSMCVRSLCEIEKHWTHLHTHTHTHFTYQIDRCSFRFIIISPTKYILIFCLSLSLERFFWLEKFEIIEYNCPRRFRTLWLLLFFVYSLFHFEKKTQTNIIQILATHTHTHKLSNELSSTSLYTGTYERRWSSLVLDSILIDSISTPTI